MPSSTAWPITSSPCAAMANSPRPFDLLLAWVERSTPEPGRAWLREAVARAAAGGESDLMRDFAIATRRLGKADLVLSWADLEAAQRARPDWRPGDWSVDQAGRALLLLAAPAQSGPSYAARVDMLFRLADVREQLALLRSLPLLPHGEHFIEMALAGVRSNSTALLSAVAFDNPYAPERFTEAQWNGMALKCLFLDLGVDRMIGISARMNEELERMVADLVRERRSAGRQPPLDAWRFMRPPVKVRSA